MNYGAVFWRVKGTKQWRTGWFVEFKGNRVRIGLYINAPEHSSMWYDKNDIDYKERKT